MQLDLTGLNAIVTGASKGIGFTTALTLAQEGARVTLVARNADTLAEAAERIADILRLGRTSLGLTCN